MTARPVKNYVITPHGRFEMKRRGLDEKIVDRVLKAPEQRYNVRPGRDVLQARIEKDPGGKRYLVRVFVDVDRHPAEVVTTYQTSKIEKYWRPET